MKTDRILLVGDNAFHGISHLSQERAISRGKNLFNPEYAAGLVNTALDNGADGFMFSVSDMTLSIIRIVCAHRKPKSVKLYAIVPYVFEFVRMAVTEGGIPGLSKKIGKDIIISANFNSIIYGTKGLITTDPSSLLKAYLLYEESRIRRAAGKGGDLSSIFLHEVVSDMGISLNLEWLFKSHIELLQKRGIKPGIHTHNLPILVERLNEWRIDLDKIALTTQFNSLGFGMTPSREKCEQVLQDIQGNDIIGYGLLASGYVKIIDALKYINGLPQLKTLALGISNEQQAKETFKFIKREINIY